MHTPGTSVILPQAEDGVFALRNRASRLILVTGDACHARRGDPRRDDELRHVAFAWALDGG